LPGEFFELSLLLSQFSLIFRSFLGHRVDILFISTWLAKLLPELISVIAPSIAPTSDV
jgi:hypothetical protein